MRYLTLCSGIEAPTLAWRPLGWQPVAFAEVDPFCNAVLANHYPEVPNLGDINAIEEEAIKALGPVGVVCGGTPCQGFSVAGTRGGMADPRSQLALRFVELVAIIRPAWVVWENVPGVLSSDEWRDFAVFLDAMAGIGYFGAWRVLDAQYFGLAQRRKRVFAVFHLGDWRRAAAVLVERNSLSGNPPPSREAGEGVAGTLASRTSGGGGLGTDVDCDGYAVPDVSYALNAKGGSGRIDGESETFIAHTLRGEGFDASEDGTNRGTPLVPIAFNYDKSEKTRSMGETKDCSPSCRAKGGVAVAFQTRIARNGRGQPKDIADALTSSEGGTHADSKPHVAGAFGVRRLTPRECERIMGVPDDFTLVPYRGKPAKDGPRYKALGNSIAVPVLRWIGERLMLVESHGGTP